MNNQNDSKCTEELLTIKELAQMLKTKTSKVRQMVFKKEIDYIKIGRLVRFNRKTVRQWIKENTKFQGGNNE